MAVAPALIAASLISTGAQLYTANKQKVAGKKLADRQIASQNALVAEAEDKKAQDQVTEAATQAQQQSLKENKRRQAQYQGRAGTILTGPSGVGSYAGNNKTILGGS